jgi:hypothetical protein
MNEDVAVWEWAEIRMLAVGVRDADDSNRHFTGIARLSSLFQIGTLFEQETAVVFCFV